ncbi:MAG: DUF1476 domain-containing protein [Alphaproteobacteria bacterium]|nr:DUF1476 domain-containing protein [Alphaproteobacteria bacterium]
MNTFNDREKTFEKKFAHDEETNFKITARRNKLLGLWVAEHLGLEGDEAEAYAKQVVRADFEEPGEEDVFRKVWGDLQAKELDLSEHRVRRQMADLMEEAREQIVNE